ncbi:MAG: ABC transporter substrate-binding protein [Planctomycetota bacterium]|jgi:branched-chain amino acid transport system substrate-binding protein|nr:ABC transporter substrate-binding protein [Planctomycetota bacterium]
MNHMKVIQRINLLLLSLFGFCLLIGCGDGHDHAGHDHSGHSHGPQGDILIAIAGPMSGSGAAFGEQIKKAATLKIEQINAAGGIDGRKVKLQIEDDKGDPTEAANVARKLAAMKKVSIVIGHFNSSCSKSAKDEYNRKGVVEFSPGSTNVDVCRGGPWTFRNLYRDDYQGTFLARYAKEILKVNKVAVFFDNDDYGAGLKNAFISEAKKIDLAVIQPIPYQRERTQDFKPLVEQIKGQGAGAVFISGLFNEAALISKALRNDLKMDVPVLAGDGVYEPKYISLAGRAAEGTYITTPFLFNTGNDSKEAVAFMSAYKKKYDEEPSTWSALTYDAVGMAIAAIDEVGTDRKKIKEWFAACTTADKGYKGVTGITFFDKEGDCYSKGASVAIVSEKKFKPAPQQLTVEQ